MKMELELWFGQDQMQQGAMEVRTVKEGLDRVLLWLDKAHDPIDGKRLWDWTEINVKFTK